MRQFDRQFKEEAVRMVAELGRPVSTVAKELGIHENTLYKWLDLSKKHKENAFPGTGHQRPEDEEIRRLKRMVADLQEENAIKNFWWRRITSNKKPYFCTSFGAIRCAFFVKNVLARRRPSPEKVAVFVYKDSRR